MTQTNYLRILMIRFPVALLVVAAVAIPALAAPALAGDLDLTFNGDGKTTTNFGSRSDQGAGVAIQPADGKIVVAGFSETSTGYDFAVARYNTDSTLDTTFSGDGKVTTTMGIGYALASDVAIQPDGKIVVVGYSDQGSASTAIDHDFAMVRYNVDGSLDTTFDTDGIATTDFGPKIDEAHSVAIQPDDKIVVVGSSDQGSTFSADYDFAVARYNTDGSPDTGFDTDGKATTDIGGSTTDGADSVVIQTDGKIVAAGGANFYGFALVRYNADGSPDTGFDTDSIATTDFGGGWLDGALGVAIQADGKIVAAGVHRDGTQGDFAVARYNTNGTLDTTFDTDGKLTTSIGSDFDFAEDVVIQPDGKIVVAGYSYSVNNSNDFAVARYNADGTLDTTFSGDGVATTDFGFGPDQAYGVAIQTDGKIVAAGYSDNGVDYEFAVARYEETSAGIVGPMIRMMKPTPNSTIKDATPTIRARITDTQTNLHKSDIQLYLDGIQKTKFKYDASTDRLSYTSNKLNKGTHTVKIVATNNAQGTSTTETFSFIRK